MIKDLEKLSKLIEKDEYLRAIAKADVLAEVSYGNKSYPIQAFTIGSRSPECPVFFVTGGIHGLERIGAQLAWSLLKTSMDRLIWDQALRELFKNIRLVVVPLLNPVGYFNVMRSNGNGVDLMRNSPVRSTEKTLWMLGGQNISAKIPWFQGQEGRLETENQALVSLFEREAKQSSCVISLDFHSGFGLRDRIWFPFSYTAEPFDDLPAMHALTQLLEQTHPYHIYQIEPQSKGYLINGDIWDHIYLNFKSVNKQSIYLPLTLEMGSWTWVRKNPLQIFSRHGAFNPIKEHRIKRTYRRHHLLFDFLLRALNSHRVWSALEGGLKTKHEQLALDRWY